MLLGLVGFFGLEQSVIAKAQVAYDVARFAALADVNQEQVRDYRLLRYPQLELTKVTSPSCQVVAKVTEPVAILGFVELVPISISQRVSCEVE